MCSISTNSRPFSEASKEELSSIRGVCLDIDETLSTKGKLTAPAFEGLWKLKEAGLAVVPITGRPAGWCDHIARFWPVDAVVGENGAFVFYVKDGVRGRLDTVSEEGAQRDRLAVLSKRIHEQFPHVKWASDQHYREYDLAIDFCEDVKPWSQEDIQALLKICKKEGAHAKVSSIHVNAWFGDYDKYSGFQNWIKNGAPGLSLSEVPELKGWVFIGDSPNDEPLFKTFERSVGVANLSRFMDDLDHKPRWITSQESGAGFREFVDIMLRR